MGRETWIYALAFVVVLGAGALLIAPRLQRLRAGDAASASEPDAPPSILAPRPVPAKEAAWIPVSVRGVTGRLKGPVEDVEGAEARWTTPRDASVVRLELRPHAPEVAFGAAGHQWQVVEAASLAPDTEIVLEEAAPAMIVRVRESTGVPAANVPVDVLPQRGGPPLRTDGGGRS